jgi:hypothetical protein
MLKGPNISQHKLSIHIQFETKFGMTVNSSHFLFFL